MKYCSCLIFLIYGKIKEINKIKEIKLIKPMAQDYTKEQLWEIFEKLPSDLKQAIFSEETAAYISDICLRNKVGGNKISEVARYTGRVLMGILSIEEFQKILTSQLKLEEDVAKNVFYEINRYIFNPVKDSLAALTQAPVTPAPVTPTTPTPAPPTKEEVPKTTPTKPAGRDVYREPIE